MTNVVSIVPYKIFPAKLGGQKGIALFYQFFCRYHNLTCVTIKANDPSFANYKVMNIFSNSKLRYINIFYFFTLKKLLVKLKTNKIIIEHPYFGWLGILLKKSLSLELIIHSHNIESLRFKSIGKWWWKILWHYEKWVHQCADHTFNITEEDRQYMIDHYRINKHKCHVITYGIEFSGPPAPSEKLAARTKLIEQYKLQPEESIFLFNGTLNYPPNYDAVMTIVNKINPLIIGKISDYKILICGKGLPAEENDLLRFKDQNIIYAGFVDDISIYFNGADTFINPVVDGGGIKTKLVEALGADLKAISCKSGAIGVDALICNGQLLVSEDYDWESFALNMINSIGEKNHISPEFFQHFYWDNIARKASEVI